MEHPLESLKQEHRLIERVLAALEALARRLDDGVQVPPEAFDRALEFIRGFADGCHHAKEERGLFPLLAAKDPMFELGPVRVMLCEHELGRSYVSRLAQAAVAMRAGDDRARKEARIAIADYTALLRDHIAKEEGVLFPMAERALSRDELAQVAHHFAQVERGNGPDAHARFETLVHELETTVG